MKAEQLISHFNLVKESLINGNVKDQYGICKAINEVYYKNSDVTFVNTLTVEKYLFDNKPTPDNQYAEFTKNEYWLGGVYWWKCIDDFPQTKQIRIDYLTKLISNIK